MEKKKVPTGKTGSVKKTASVEKKKVPSGKTGSVRKKITAEAIQNRANEIYNQRISNGIPGDADSDWLQAESELLS